VCLRSPICIYTRQSSCNVNSTHWNQTGRSRTASPPVIAQQHSLLSSSHFFHSRREKFDASFKKFSSFRLLFSLRNLKQRQFGSVYRLSYPGSIHILRHLTVRLFSLGYILPLRRAFIPKSQGGWLLGKRQLQEQNPTLLSDYF